MEGAVRLTIRASTDLDLIGGVLIERSKGDSTPATIVLDILELGEHTSAAGDNSRDPDKGIQVNMPEISESVMGDQVGDPRVDVTVDVLVILKELQHDLLGILVKDLQGFCRGVHKVQSQHGVGVVQVDIADLQTFTVN